MRFPEDGLIIAYKHWPTKLVAMIRLVLRHVASPPVCSPGSTICAFHWLVFTWFQSNELFKWRKPQWSESRWPLRIPARIFCCSKLFFITFIHAYLHPLIQILTLDVLPLCGLWTSTKVYLLPVSSISSEWGCSFSPGFLCASAILRLWIAETSKPATRVHSASE